MFDPTSFPALTLNQKAIETANSLSQWDAGSALAREAENVYREGLASFGADYAPDTWNARQQEIADSRAAQWKELCEKAYNVIIQARASWVPWTVAGPARYNSRKNSAKADAQMRAQQEWSEKLNHFLTNTREWIRDALPMEEILAEYRSGKRQDAISGDDPAAVEKLQARVDGIRERHERGKQWNAYYRKHGTMKGFPGMPDEKAAKLDEHLNTLPPTFRQPYMTGSSTATANIRRLEQRIEEIKKAREAATHQDEDCGPKPYNGFFVEISKPDNRIYISFNGKPEVEARDVLKHNGFHWSPRAGLWMRQLTDNALYSLQHYVIPGLENVMGGAQDG